MMLYPGWKARGGRDKGILERNDGRETIRRAFEAEQKGTTLFRQVTDLLNVKM
jgi:hypothetical protein